MTPLKNKTSFSTLKNNIIQFNTETISTERKKTLQPLIHFIKEKQNTNSPIRLNFICTHNSRRSHLSQIWAQVMAHYFTIKNVSCYSGGTEATAMFPKIAEILKKTGFNLDALSLEKNPIYSIKFNENEHPIIAFSKTYNNSFNPNTHFAAIMTCNNADKGCPIIIGAEKRIPITYEDPKVFDNTPQQYEKYLERSNQIATEMKYVFEQVKK